MRGRVLPFTLASFVVLGTVAGCRSKAAPAPSRSASARASAAPRPAPTASARPAAAGCRVIGLSGAAAKEAGNPAVGRFFGSENFVDLPADVDLSLRHTETSREFVLHGPGRFQPCRGGSETILVARGSVSTTAGPGSRAGAEVLLGTPFAVIHFADARLTLSLTDQKLSLQVEQGSATVESVEASGKAQPAKTVTGPKGVLTLSGKPDADGLVKACNSAWQAVASGPPRPAGQTNAGSSGLGDWAVTQLKARRSARFACAQARATVGKLAGAEHSRLSGLLESSERPGRPVADPGK